MSIRLNQLKRLSKRNRCLFVGGRKKIIFLGARGRHRRQLFLSLRRRRHIQCTDNKKKFDHVPGRGSARELLTFVSIVSLFTCNLDREKY